MKSIHDNLNPETLRGGKLLLRLSPGFGPGMMEPDEDSWPYGFQGLGLRVQGVGFGFRVWGRGAMQIHGPTYRGSIGSLERGWWSSIGPILRDLGFRVSGLGCRVWG